MTTFDYYYNDVWNKTIDKIQQSGQIDQTALPYFKSKLVKIDENEAIVTVSAFVNYSIMSQNIMVIENCLAEVIGSEVRVRIYQEDEYNSFSFNGESFTNEFISREIDPNYTFANFIVGRSNAQAHIAAQTCASNLGIVYNPLFIYGGPGLGKTHLISAIGNQVKTVFKDKKVGYVSGEEFTEGVAKAARENKLDEFKESFYSLDLLLVDDIQFIAGKDKTHEIFFTIFNKLVNNKKQICITADRTPSDIKGLEERIISRFNQGLTVNIEAPEYETSINILKMKISNNVYCTSDDFVVDDDVLNYLATNFSQDVRSLEGSVNRLLFYFISFKKPEDKDHVTLRLAVEAFKDQIKENKNQLSISTVRKAVCEYYNLSKQQITSANRTKNIANARHIAMYLCRKLLDAPFKEIGDEFGKRDHSTVMSSCEKVEELIKTDPIYLKVINEIEARIQK